MEYQNSKSKKIVIIIAFRNFRDVEYFIPKEIFEKAGFSVRPASNKKGMAIGADGGEVKVDLLVSEIKVSDFNAVVFVGGPGCLKNLDNQDSYNIARQAVAKGVLLAALCVSPVILARAGLLKEKRATVWSSLMDKKAIEALKENGATYEDKPVVTEGSIITGNGPQSAAEFAHALTSLLLT